MRVLHIDLLGDFRLLYGDEPITSVNTPRLQSLLTYLLLHRQTPQSRQHIAFQFWPDSSEKQAHTNLRKLLFQLRNALPNPDQFLTQDHLIVQWRPDAPYTLDVAELQTTLERCLTTNGKPSAQANPDDLSKVVNLYQGQLLPSCFDEWLLSMRQQLQRDVMVAIEQLIQLAEHQREYRAGIRYAQRLLGLDPLQESAYRRLMQLHALNGDRAAALHDYHTCATILQQELGVEPDEETRTLYHRLLKMDGQPVPQPALLVDAPLVGRATAWRTLLAAWRGAQRGPAHFVSIAGEAGMGKTRLTQELLTWASAQGVRAARTRSYEAEGGLAYAPMTEWLRSGALKPTLPKLDKPWLSEVARLLPELLIEYPNLAPPTPLTEAWQRQRFFEALARATLVEKTPLLLVIDDLQWCDSETLTWLRFLLRYEPQARLLVVGAWRSEAVAGNHPLQTLLRDLSNANQLTALELLPLTGEETALLAQHVAEHKLVTAETEQLFQMTEGHPLFVIETVRALGRERIGEWGNRDAFTPTLLPTKVQSVIQARLTQLSAPARELAGLAATIGRRFTFAVVAHASHTAEDELVQALDELWQRRIIREQGADAYDFSHDRIREVAYQGLSQVRRRLLHRRVAEALETVNSATLDEVSSQLAAHYEQAALLDKASTYWQRAGCHAAARFANGEAILHLSKALALKPLAERRVRFDLLVQREALYVLQGNTEERFADLMTMQQISQEILASDAAQAAPAIQAAIRFGEYYQRAGQPEQTVASLQAAINLAQQVGEAALAARAWGCLGDALFHQGRLAAAREALLQAIGGVAGAALDDVAARAYEYLAAVAMFSGAKTAVIDNYLQAALARFHKVNDRQGINRIHNKLGYLLVAQGEGDYDRAQAYYQEGLQVCREIGHSGGESNILRNLGVLFTCTSDYAQAAHALQAAVENDRRRKDLHSEGVALNYLGGMYLNMGDYRRAHECQSAALTYLQQTKSNGWICKIWSELSLLHWLQGESASAREAAERAHALAQEVGDRRQVGYALTRLGRALNGLGCYPAAAAFHEAYALHCDLEQYNRALEPLAGLALSALQQQDFVQAIHYVETILAHLQTRQLDRTDEALHVYMSCYRVLKTLNDPQAATLLQLAYEQLQVRATSLEAESERALFWSAPIHADVLTTMQNPSATPTTR